MIDRLADAIFFNIVYYSVDMVFACQIFINKHAKRLRGMRMFDRNIIYFKEGREGKLLSFGLEPFNLNSVLVIYVSLIYLR